MDDTPNLALPYIMAAQAQKHVTHNEAIRALDVLVQLAVLDRDLPAPPGSPADGARYIVADSPSGAWAGEAGSIAAWQDGAWRFYAPQQGWLAWAADEGVLLVFDGADWVAATSFGDPLMLGINATADTTNRLAVASDASLFTHDGADHRMKINKADAGDTASQLFQTGFSGRAEFGLTGDDDWHVKVSPDGTNWYEALIADRATGRITFPNTPGRETLAADRTYYVRTDGSDSNDGLANTAGGAFLTIQKALDVILGTLDLGGFDAIIQVADGTYTGQVVGTGPQTGAGSIIIRGNASNPENVIVSCTALGSTNGAITAERYLALTVEDLELRTTTSGDCLVARLSGVILFDNVRFGAAAGAHILSFLGGLVWAQGDYAITGSAGIHWWAAGTGSEVRVQSRTITISGTPAFSSSFANASSGVITATSNTYSGSATGPRFRAEYNGVIRTANTSLTLLPGNAVGIARFGGRYESVQVVFDNGTKTTGTFTPDPANGDVQKAVNGGAHTLSPPTTPSEIVLRYTNNASAGAITTSGFSRVVGSFNTTNTNQFEARISYDGTASLLRIVALQ
jgi:hypothetical protein